MTFAQHLKQCPAPKIVILTGAGISAESGIRTFRDNNGLWENHRVEDVATPAGFTANPERVYRFYNDRRAQLLSNKVQPHAAHIALGKLEQSLGENLVIVTQNVDNLHERGGNNNVIHMHGSLLSALCPASQQKHAALNDITAQSYCSCCTPAVSLRPDIVWFGEIPYHMEAIEKHLYDADLFVSIGTSGNVYPAAGFVHFANQCGAHTLELNLEPSSENSEFAERRYGPASVLVPAFVEECLRSI